jgi:hypothetical protein
MMTRQGDLGLLNDPVAQRLLLSTFPARLAYNWKDGTPRVVPIAFHWDGKEIVLGTPPDAPKMQVLRDGVKVALTIDSDSLPFKVLLIRGTVHTEIVEGITPQYEASVVRMFGQEGGQAWLDQMRPICPRMSRIFIRPEWVGILDFETRFPSALERAMKEMVVA